MLTLFKSLFILSFLMSCCINSGSLRDRHQGWVRQIYKGFTGETEENRSGQRCRLDTCEGREQRKKAGLRKASDHSAVLRKSQPGQWGVTTKHCYGRNPMSGGKGLALWPSLAQGGLPRRSPGETQVWHFQIWSIQQLPSAEIPKADSFERSSRWHTPVAATAPWLHSWGWNARMMWSVSAEQFLVRPSFKEHI